MHQVKLPSETDFESWRGAARAMVLNGIAPADISWTVQGREPELFEASKLPSSDSGQTLSVPASFVELARAVVLHHDLERFALLYRLLWRCRAQPRLLAVSTDEDVARAHSLARQVRRDQHKMKAFVRFREFGRDPSRFIAWFEPAHHIVEATAPFFERRFGDMAWSILTPERCAHWDGHKTTFTAGASKADAPSGDPLEHICYYASIFNPARLKIKAMQAEMPKKYWRNLPEASLIDPLIAKAARATEAMVDRDPAAPRASQQRKEATGKEAVVQRHLLDDTLDKLHDEARECRACPLWRDATQTVFGEGPQDASVMLVGEQPGDKEDLAGRPFVGPAGQVLDRALKDAGIERGKVYVTNAVKHFKFVPRGKIRLHQKPSTLEIKACRPWYERERAAIKPALVVAMGATAAQSVLGKITTIGKVRGRLIDLDDRTKALVTVHPSYLLRLPDEDAKAREYQRFVEDLKIAAGLLRGINCAA